MHTKGGFRAKSAIFADFNDIWGVHTGTGKKEMKSKNHDFIGENRNTGRADRGTGWGWLENRMASSVRLNWSVSKA